MHYLHRILKAALTRYRYIGGNMAFDYKELGIIATDLLKEFGQLITITRKTDEQYNPATGSNQQTIETYTGYGCAFHYSNNEIDGTRILTGDMVVLLENIATAPVIGDSVLVNGMEMRLISIERVSPANIDVIYKLQVRQ